MILLRQGFRVLHLSQCNVDLSRRFCFYDQVHTTGMDIKHVVNARAALTLGKDMTFRDFAQAAWRMRGIGAGQTIELILVPEVLNLVRDDAKTTGLDVGKDFLEAVCSWLLVNSMRSESMQFRLMCEQSMKNVFRKSVYRHLTKIHNTQVGVPVDEHQFLKSTSSSLELFRERVDYTVANTVPRKASHYIENGTYCDGISTLLEK